MKDEEWNKRGHAGAGGAKDGDHYARFGGRVTWTADDQSDHICKSCGFYTEV